MSNMAVIVEGGGGVGPQRVATNPWKLPLAPLPSRSKKARLASGS